MAIVFIEDALDTNCHRTCLTEVLNEFVIMLWAHHLVELVSLFLHDFILFNQFDKLLILVLVLGLCHGTAAGNWLITSFVGAYFVFRCEYINDTELAENMATLRHKHGLPVIECVFLLTSFTL